MSSFSLHESKEIKGGGGLATVALHDEEDGFEMRSRSSKLRGTEADERDMEILGRKQQLNASRSSHLCFRDAPLTSLTAEFGLINGGTAGLIWGYLITWAGYSLVFASIAEMAAMAPTSGGQYHWVSEFAPRRIQRFLSYMTGWISVLGWQTGCASLAFLAGTVIQGLIVINNANYVFENWHGTLLVIAITVFAIIFNSFLAKKLPMVEGIVLIIHLLGFFAVLIALWVLSPRSDPTSVFTQFSNGGGWSTTGTSVMVGLLSPVYALIGSDSAVHMSEEIKDAGVVLPRAMMWAMGLNGFLGFVMLITFCFTLGSIDEALGTETGYPFIQVFYDSTNSNVGTSILTAILIVSLTSACISTVATVSRQTWSFARDHGLPFSSTIAYVMPGWNIPLNAVMVTLLVTVLLSLINIGSSVAFNAIGSLAITALLGSYIISISVLILRRVRNLPLPARRWTLGRAGIFVNIGAVAFLLVVWVFTLFPIAIPVTPATMNWNCLMFGSAMIFAVAYYAVWGRKSYIAPVLLVKRNI
ncbi:hypothetical protein MMC17_001629 [Xylographa soralifera]|nr:hypothetical protein [Xylographa soralifera]